jgi:hypothetical protein
LLGLLAGFVAGLSLLAGWFHWLLVCLLSAGCRSLVISLIACLFVSLVVIGRHCHSLGSAWSPPACSSFGSVGCLVARFASLVGCRFAGFVGRFVLSVIAGWLSVVAGWSVWLLVGLLGLSGSVCHLFVSHCSSSVCLLVSVVGSVRLLSLPLVACRLSFRSSVCRSLVARFRCHLLLGWSSAGCHCRFGRQFVWLVVGCHCRHCQFGCRFARLLVWLAQCCHRRRWRRRCGWRRRFGARRHVMSLAGAYCHWFSVSLAWFVSSLSSVVSFAAVIAHWFGWFAVIVGFASLSVCSLVVGWSARLLGWLSAGLLGLFIGLAHCHGWLSVQVAGFGWFRWSVSVGRFLARLGFIAVIACWLRFVAFVGWSLLVAGCSVVSLLVISSSPLPRHCHSLLFARCHHYCLRRLVAWSLLGWLSLPLARRFARRFRRGFAQFRCRLSFASLLAARLSLLSLLLVSFVVIGYCWFRHFIVIGLVIGLLLRFACRFRFRLLGSVSFARLSVWLSLSLSVAVAGLLGWFVVFAHCRLSLALAPGVGGWLVRLPGLPGLLGLLLARHCHCSVSVCLAGAGAGCWFARFVGCLSLLGWLVGLSVWLSLLVVGCRCCSVAIVVLLHKSSIGQDCW